MRVIRASVPLAEEILGKAALQIGQPCRLLTYIVRAEHTDGTLLYNVMTKAVVLLTPEETAMIDALPAAFTEAHRVLADLWFIVPADNDDMSLSDGLKAVVMALDSQQPKPLTTYTIFTTTDCNARCFYCFEAGTRRYSMTEQTAHDVAAFIVSHCEGNPVSLHWFGGEPLLNSHVIDIICADLRQADIKFKSSMISNGYLFDEEMIQKAAADWKLTRVQITLDGTEEQYNRRKAYVRVEGSPYQRVMRNINLLDQAGIQVNVRLNTELANVKNIRHLCDELRKYFLGYEHTQVYIAPLMENKGRRPVVYVDADKEKIFQLTDQMQQWLITEGMYRPSGLEHRLRCQKCMADSENCTSILPDGRLGRCKCITDTGSSVSIYSLGDFETELFKWQKVLPPQPECISCFFYPKCIRLVLCPNRVESCESYMRESFINKLRRELITTYIYYLSKYPSMSEGPMEC